MTRALLILAIAQICATTSCTTSDHSDDYDPMHTPGERHDRLTRANFEWWAIKLGEAERQKAANNRTQ
tara:strand:- start:25226 stop:25429 length:204 start_codon:yes stop_codon:yes gene_type:complete